MKKQTKNQSILIADDNPKNLMLLSEALSTLGYDIRVAIDGRAVIESAQAQCPDLILMDIHMPEMDGYEACKIIKSDIRTAEIPIIFISALNEEFNKVKAFQLGAVDYLTKPIQMEEIKARVEVHLQLRSKLQELEVFNKIMVDREMRIIELKKEVNSLCVEAGKPEPYPVVWEE